jgi:hypothetical protein
VESFSKEDQLYLDGTTTLDDFIAKLNDSAKKEAAKLKKSQGWSKENNDGLRK